ncbi:MAG TPA: META domain-containing protein [Chloroflexi bacterium]|jgi:heat shock protein HslJ|nr:META domain-containing protein [Chloroflexota bacterium]
MHRISTLVILAALLAALTLSACGVEGAAPGTTDQPSLAGTQWVLTEINGRPALDDPEVTLVFDDSNAGGDAGCNSYGGDYTAEDGTLTFGEIVSTLRLCVDEEVMAQETAFLDTLRQTEGYRVSGDRLEIIDAAGTTILVFAAAQ